MDMPAPFIQVEALYFQARETGTSVAIYQQEPSSRLENGKVIHPSFKTHFGGRIQGGLFTPEDNWEVSIQFLHYHARVTEEFKEGIFYPTWVHPAKDSGGYVDQLRSRWRLHLGVLDLMLAKGWDVSACLQLKPYAGLRFAGVRFKSRIDYRGGTLFPGAEEDISMKNKFWGVGPLVGIESLWRLGESFGLFAKAGCSLLYGNTYIHQDEEETGSDQGKIKLYDEFKQTRKIAEMGIGFDLRHCIGCSQLYARVGWQLYFLLGANQALRFVDSSMEGNVVGNLGDLILQGLTFGVGLNF